MNAKPTVLVLLTISWIGSATGAEPIVVTSPGLSASTVDSKGRLVEDWGSVDIRLKGAGVTKGEASVSLIKIERLVPAARVTSSHGVLRMTRTIYRAPTFPAGVDVLQVDLEAAKDKAVQVTVALDVSAGTQLGRRTARIGGRTVLVLPREVVDDQPLLEWGYCDEASSLPGWAKPKGACDKAFRSIRAGMGGVPIVYHFAVAPRSEANVVLGLCESHWSESGRRPVLCQVEGAAPQKVDPVAKWGQHEPGALLFRGKDENGDGKLIVSVRPISHASDRNPILNAIWIYPPGEAPSLKTVIAGKTNLVARYYVDVGGEKDQSVFPPVKMEFPVSLEAGGKQQMTFLVACPGASAPVPDLSDWTPAKLLRAATDVWRDWAR